MDNRFYSLKDVINNLFSSTINDFEHLYLTGADFYAADRKLMLRLCSDTAKTIENERHARLMLAEIFGCAEVDLQITANLSEFKTTDSSEVISADSSEDISADFSEAVSNDFSEVATTDFSEAVSNDFSEVLSADFSVVTSTGPAPPRTRAGAKKATGGGAKGASARNGNKRKAKPRDNIRAGSFTSSMKGIEYKDGAYFDNFPDIICGVPITAAPSPLSEGPWQQLERITIQGEIVALAYRPIRKGEIKILECGISDGAGSIAVKLFIPDKDMKFFEKKLAIGDEIIAYGEIQNDAFLKEQALYAVDINKYHRMPRMDTADVKRVELHLHTQMSAMDAITPAAALIKRAAEFGHPAVAITDHGVVQAYPDAYNAGKKHGIKIIYGIEAYLDTKPCAASFRMQDSEKNPMQPSGSGTNAISSANANTNANAISGTNANADAGFDTNTSINANTDAGAGADADANLMQEAYNEPNHSKSPYHIIILAKNQIGMKNLYKLVSMSHLDYFYRRPLMPRNIIEAHREGLIIGSACEAGEIFTAVRERRNRREIVKLASFYDYLEIQPIGNNMFLLGSENVGSVGDLEVLNKTITEIGDELGIPVAATCDIHFLDPKDEQFRRILMSGQGYKDADSQPPLYFRTTGEMLEEFQYLGGDKAFEVVVTNTNKINSWIEGGLKPIPDGMFTPVLDGADEELCQITELSAKEKYGEVLPAPIRERLDQELNIITSKNFSVLYMIARKLVKRSNEDGYIVGSRGSVGSSLVATLIGITEVNPLPPHYLCAKCKYLEFSANRQISSGFDLPDKLCPQCGQELDQDGQDIMFEIFIGAKGLEKAPDIDLNFSGEYQLQAHKYAEELFGEANVFKAGTIGTIANKTAYGFVKKYLESKGLAPGKFEEERLTAGCSGVKRNTGQHPGGLIVVPHGMEIYDFTPIQHPADVADKNIITTHFDFNALKETILKLDLLGHDDPSIIKMLEELTGVKSDSIKMNDKAIMSLFTGTSALGVKPEAIGSPVGTIGLPEFGTRFIRQMLVDTQPKTFSDLLQISGLSHGTNVWLNNAQDLIRKNICTVSEVIGTRESLVLYLMNHGLDQTAAFEIMEAVRKKGGKVSEENEKKMLANGVPEWYIDSCNKIEYLFTKGHATAYVQMAYLQAWYKIHEPLAFYAAYYSIRADEFDADVMTRGPERAKLRLSELNRQGREISQREQKILTILEVVIEMYARGIVFLPVDLYRSDADKFLIENGAIRPPLNSLAGLGAAAAIGICAARESKPFLSVDDMIIRAKTTKTVVDILRSYGALDGLPGESQMSLYDLMATN